ncbi:hypothetical protein BGX34_008877 [Mortierella sp. NVP85]|nr:hypothetical protein BGX34_008877 [Mortierella sp. NVP85]
MDSTWTAGSTAAHPVGHIHMGHFDWARESPSDQSRPVSLQSFHAAPNSQNNNGNGNIESGLNGNGAHNNMGGATHHNGDPLASSLAAGALQQGELVRTTPPTPSREDLHHHHAQPPQQAPQHPQAPPQQQPIQVHHTHSPYHHGQIPGHELSPHEQQQQPVFQPPHAYAQGHYYQEQDQHESYEHERMHSGGLVGHAYGHSHDNIAALTPPPSAPMQHDLPPLRTRLTNTIWEDEHTFCYQVDVKGVCVARRADNHMVNGTKLLNVVGMSRGKRDGILKNEKGRVVVKVGAMHLKGVWIPLDRALHHAKAHNIEENLYPLLVEDPTVYLYQHPHSAAVASDMRWPQQAQHGPYHDNDNSPKARHSEMHGHHFGQGVHGDYYAHQQHHIFRGHGVSSPHGSPHGSNGSVSGDDETNLSSPFDYRMQQPMATGGLIGIPPGGAPVSELRSGNHHPTYYGHQPGPNQYYGAHLQQKYSDPILHPGQHLQIGGPVANDSPPPISAAGHDGSQNRLQASLLSGQRRYGANNVSESNTPPPHNYYGYQATHPQKSHSVPDVYSTDPSQFGLTSGGGMGGAPGSFSPSASMTPSEAHSPQQHGDVQIQNVRHSHSGIIQPMTKRPRQVSRSISMTEPPTGQWYNREDSFDRMSNHSAPSSDAPSGGPLNYSMTSDGSGNMYYDARPRFVPSAAPMPYGATGPSSPQRSRSRLSSFQDSPSGGGGGAMPGNMSPFGRVQSPEESKPTGAQLVKVEGVAGGYEAAAWS